MNAKFLLALVIVALLSAPVLPWTRSVQASEDGIPGAPTNVRFEAIPNGVRILWDPPADLGAGAGPVYEVRAGFDPDSAWVVGWVQDPQTSVEFIPWGSYPTWHFLVTAVNEDGAGPSSERAQYQTRTPGPLAGVRAFAVGGPGQGDVLWDLPSPDDGGADILGHNIYAAESEAGPYALVGTAHDGALGYRVSGFPIGARIFATVASFNIVGEGQRSAIVNMTIPEPPSAPLNLSAVSGPLAGQARLSWDPPAYEGDHGPVQGYSIWRRPGAYYAWEGVAEVDGTTRSYVLSGLDHGATLEFQVVAHNVVNQGYGATTNGTTFWPPGAPGSTAARRGDEAGTIVVTWEPPISDGGSPVTVYRVYAATASGGPYTIAGETACCSFTHTGLGPDVTRFYKVSAVSGAGEGPQSASASATTIGLASAPTSFSATAGPAAGEIRLSWAPPSQTDGLDVTGYRVFSRPGSTGPFTLLAVVEGDARSHVAGGLGDGAYWSFRVGAVTEAGNGTMSDSRGATTFVEPAAPSADAAGGPAIGENIVSWTPPSFTGGTSITGYVVYRLTDGSITRIADLPAGARSYTDTGRPLYAQDVYHVSAVNVVGEGPADTTGCVRPFSLAIPCL